MKHQPIVAGCRPPADRRITVAIGVAAIVLATIATEQPLGWGRAAIALAMLGFGLVILREWPRRSRS